MQEQIERLKLYLQIKWTFIGVAFALVLIEMHLRVLSAGYYAAFAGLSLSAVTAAVLWFSLRRNRNTDFAAHLSLSCDTLSLILTLYFMGGVENIWFFTPVIIILTAAQLFDLRTGVAYAAFSYLLVATVFSLEYAGFIPHFSLYGVSGTPWRIPVRYINYLIGLALLYFIVALIVGRLSQISRRALERLNQSLADSKDIQHNAENTQKALLNVAEDLEMAKADLERRVRERTTQLEEAKAGLETKVAERTADLEKARKAVQHMLKDLKEDMTKLQAIDRMKSEFLSMVSHELRTPITPIKGYLAMLLAGQIGKVAPPQTKALKIINRQSEHLQGLIESLLDISRLELGKPIPTHKEPLSIKKIIENIVEALKIIIEGRGLSLKLELAENLPTILGDETKLKRILTNLIGNSIKFTPKGGEIRIRALAEDLNVRVEVIDNGIGIAGEYMEKVFDKFFQVDSSFTRAAGGIGMGLAICKELVELHGGKIWAESEGPEKGTKLVFVIPTRGGR